MKYYLGIEIGGTKFQAVIGDSNSKIIDRYRTNVDTNLGAEGIRKEIRKAIAYFSSYKPLSIGLGFGGPIDFRKGKIWTSHQIHGWNNFHIRSWLKKISGLPVQVDNDANIGAMAESLKGNRRKNDSIFFVTLGSGMGGGMFIDGQIYHGEKPGEAEIGMTPFDRHGNTMESQCCGWSVDAKIRKYTKSSTKSVLAELTKGINKGEAKYLTAAIAKGDIGANKLLDETADNIAFAFSYVVLLFHPRIIVIGGGLSLIGETLINRINESLPKYVGLSFHPVPKVEVSSLGEDVICIGALLLAIQISKKGK